MSEETDEKPIAIGWCVLELMGHRRLGGYVSEAVIAGTGLIRIDVPGPGEKRVTQFYSPAALYCLTPTTEELARAVAESNQPQPVHEWELPASTAVRGVRVDREDERDDEEDEAREQDDDEDEEVTKF